MSKGIFSDILLTVDYDRTLTAPDSTIPTQNIEAIRYFMENGGAFTINTGRSLPMAQVILDNVPVNAPLLLYNGSATYDTVSGKLCAYQEIQLDFWKTINTCISLLPDLFIEVQGMDAHYCFPDNSMWHAFCEQQLCAHKTANYGEDLGPFLKFAVYGQFRDVTVSHMFSGSVSECAAIDRAEKVLRKEFGDYLEIHRSAPRYLDLHAKGTSKARSARELQAQLRRKILICVGDGVNDLSMMEEADFSYAPSDGAIAPLFDTVCNCADGSIADVIFRKIPNICAK